MGILVSYEPSIIISWIRILASYEPSIIISWIGILLTCGKQLHDRIVWLRQSESRLDNGVFSNDLSYTFLYRNRTRFRIHRPSVENSLVLIVASVKYNRGSEKNIENCFFHINLRPGAWTSCNKGVLQKLNDMEMAEVVSNNTKN
jgi:hypothetical protein